MTTFSEDSSKVILKSEFYSPELIAECHRRFHPTTLLIEEISNLS